MATKKRNRRDGKVYGRTKSKRKENVAVYCDALGATCISIWTVFKRPVTLRMSLSAARVLRKALGDYLDAA